MKSKPWHDRMVTIWVRPEMRDHINSLRDPDQKIKTADDVLEKYLPPIKPHRESKGGV